MVQSRQISNRYVPGGAGSLPSVLERDACRSNEAVCTSPGSMSRWVPTAAQKSCEPFIAARSPFFGPLRPDQAGAWRAQIEPALCPVLDPELRLKGVGGHNGVGDIELGDEAGLDLQPIGKFGRHALPTARFGANISQPIRSAAVRTQRKTGVRVMAGSASTWGGVYANGLLALAYPASGLCDHLRGRETWPQASTRGP